MNSSKAPNLKAPRFRGEKEGTLNNESCKDIRKKVFVAKDLTDAEIKTIVRTFNELFFQTVIDKRDGVELPQRLGHVFIGSCPKKKSVNLDYKKTAELDEIVQHRNWESDGYLAKIFYSSYPKKYRLRHKEIWKFIPIRDFTRAVGKTYPEKWKMYVEVDPKQKISHMFLKNTERMNTMDLQEVQLETYNEFDI
jgi:alpha-ketoglutarate-dependent taurine dioxygenase